MEKLKRQTASEIKQLPYMLCKLLGGVMTAIGLPGAIFVMSRKANASVPDIVPFILAGVAGIVIFAVSSRALAKHAGGNRCQTPAPKEKKGMNIAAWTGLLLLAAIFLIFTFCMTRQ